MFQNTSTLYTILRQNHASDHPHLFMNSDPSGSLDFIPHCALTNVSGNTMKDLALPLDAVAYSHTADTRCLTIADCCQQIKDEQYRQMHRDNPKTSTYFWTIFIARKWRIYGEIYSN